MSGLLINLPKHTQGDTHSLFDNRTFARTVDPSLTWRPGTGACVPRYRCLITHAGTRRTQRVLSGMQPTGSGLHLGNYLGAMRSWLALQDKYETYYCVVDLHAITIPQDPVALRNATVSSAAVYMAAGVDPERATLFVQSHVPAHSEMTWLLNCVTPIGWMERMIQFKVRRGHHRNVHSINEDHVDARQLSPQLAQRDRDARARAIDSKRC